jgi:hypothetical protein
MNQSLLSIVKNSKILDQYLEKDQSLDQLLKEIDGEGKSEKLLSSVIEMKSPVNASELLPIYRRRLRLIPDSEPENKHAIFTLVKLCEEEPDSLIKTISITSETASYHMYFQVLDQSLRPISVIVGRPIPKGIELNK